MQESNKQMMQNCTEKSKGFHQSWPGNCRGLAMSTVPKVSFRVLETLIGIAVAWFLTEVQHLLKSLSSIADMIPSWQTLYRIMVQFCVDVIMLKSVDLRD